MTQSSNRLRFFRFNRHHHQQTPANKTGSTAAASPSTMNGLGDPTSDHVEEDNVQGWLMNVPGYRQQRYNTRSPTTTTTTTIVDADNNSIPVERRSMPPGRPASITSISSNDSVNLDELIKNNYAEQVDDETDLLNLAGLDLDDSTEDFWKMDNTLAHFVPKKQAEQQRQQQRQQRATGTTTSDLLDGTFDELTGMSTNDDELMNWSPEDERLETLSNASYTSSKTVQTRLRAPSALSSSQYSASSPEQKLRRQRSSSLSSENSLTSQSTVTTGVNNSSSHYARYGMTPVLHPSESTASNSSRSHSRLSNYSAGSSQASSNTSALPRPRNGASCTANPPGRRMSDKSSSSSGEPPLRSSSRIGTRGMMGGGGGGGGGGSNTSASRLAKRATHVPLPSSRSVSKPQVVTSSRSTGLSSSRLNTNSSNATASRPGSRIGGLRSSHIPAPPPPRNTAASPEPRARSPTLGPARSSGYRPRSPFTSSNSNAGSRIGMARSPTPTNGSGGGASSLFGMDATRRVAQKEPSPSDASRIARPPSAAAGSRKPTGLRPPGALSKLPASSARR